MMMEEAPPPPEDGEMMLGGISEAKPCGEQCINMLKKGHFKRKLLAKHRRMDHFKACSKSGKDWHLTIGSFTEQIVSGVKYEYQNLVMASDSYDQVFTCTEATMWCQPWMDKHTIGGLETCIHY